MKKLHYHCISNTALTSQARALLQTVRVARPWDESERLPTACFRVWSIQVNASVFWLELFAQLSILFWQRDGALCGLTTVH